MWDQLPVANLISMQRVAALESIDRQITEDHQAGYSVDELLDRRLELTRLLQQGPVA